MFLLQQNIKVYFFHTNGKVIYYPYHFSNGNSLIHFESFAVPFPFFYGMMSPYLPKKLHIGEEVLKHMDMNLLPSSVLLTHLVLFVMKL
jgi:hypothetical protein